MALRTLASVVALALALPLTGSALTGPATAADARYASAVSQPVEKPRYYGHKGDPGIDVLHYDLDLSWLRGPRVLRGTADIRLRVVTGADDFALDLARTMRVARVTVDGRRVGFDRRGDHLVVERRVRAGQRHTVRVTYAGTPEPVRGPASRPDIAKLGMRVTKSGQLWTMQEPWGALTWYPANEQPWDKALYDVRVDAPGRWVGVSNGRLESRRTADGRTVTEWTNRHPMAAYLMTLAVGPYEHYRQTGPDGLPLNYWVPRKRADKLVKPLLRTPEAIRWLERKLGPYPFDSAGVVVTPRDSAMETQTLITFGVHNYRYGNRDVRQTLVHELAHHWYGDTVTPRDWRDLWMNEGMATYLDTRWAVAQGWTRWKRWQRSWAADDQFWRDIYGPPGAYKRRHFAAINVYYCSALMLDRLRQRIGNRAFSTAMRAWPQQHLDENQDRGDYVRFLERRTGKELSAFFRRWLNSEKSPA